MNILSSFVCESSVSPVSKLHTHSSGLRSFTTSASKVRLATYWLMKSRSVKSEHLATSLPGKSLSNYQCCKLPVKRRQGTIDVVFYLNSSHSWLHDYGQGTLCKGFANLAAPIMHTVIFSEVNAHANLLGVTP